MSRDDFDLYLWFVTGLSAVLSMVNLLLVKRRGSRAYLLASAFLLLGLGAYLYKISASDIVLGFVGALLAILLLIDFASRPKTRRT